MEIKLMDKRHRGYELTGYNCDKVYIGQSRRAIDDRVVEHYESLLKNNNISNSAVNFSTNNQF